MTVVGIPAALSLAIGADPALGSPALGLWGILSGGLLTYAGLGFQPWNVLASDREPGGGGDPGSGEL